MGIRDTFERIATSVDKVANSLGSLNDQVDRAAGIEFTSAPASFVPPPPPAAPGTPTNPITGPSPLPSPPGTIFDAFGRPLNRTSPRSTSSSGGRGGGSSQFTLAESALIPSMTPGAMLLRRTDLDGFVARGVCEIMQLPSGGHVISCPWGLYPATDGVLSSMSLSRSASSGGGNRGGSGRPAREGLTNERRHDFNRPFKGRNNNEREDLGRAGGSSSVSLDDHRITERLDGLRSDVQQMTRALTGDGGASVRFKGGF